MDDRHEPQWSYARQREVCRCGEELPCQVKHIIAELYETIEAAGAWPARTLPPVTMLSPVARTG